MKRNTTLLDLFRANARTFGVVESPESRERMGSSDVGNVSQVIPPSSRWCRSRRRDADPLTRVRAGGGAAAGARRHADVGQDHGHDDVRPAGQSTLVKDARREFEAAK